MFRQPQATPSRQADVFNVKMPKAPERPLVPYMRYSRKMWPKVRAENPEAQLWDISKIIGQMWKEVTEGEKTVYQHEYELEKVEYDKAFKAYQNSAPYQNYLNATKNRGKTAEKVSRSRMDTGGVVIQPVDEEEINNEISARRVAAVRFDRNHRLIAELFNSSMVADTRAVTGQQRIEMLRKQAQSLMNHQNKLEDELKRLQDNFSEKKRNIHTSSDDFAQQLKKVCDEKPVVDESAYEDMVEEWRGKLGEAYEQYRKKEEKEAAVLAVEREKMAHKTPVLYGLTVDSPTETHEDSRHSDISPS